MKTTFSHLEDESEGWKEHNNHNLSHSQHNLS